MKAFYSRLIFINLFNIFSSNGFELPAGNNTCDPLIIQTTQGCFKIEGENMKFNQAREFCLQKNAALATPESMEVNNEIKKFIKPLNEECSNDSKFKFWIGLSMVDKVFRFDGQQIDLPYTDWDPEFPDVTNVPETLGCALYRCDNGQYSWKPNMCTDKSHFICQLNSCPEGCHIVTTTVEPTTEATTEPTTMMTTSMMNYDYSTHDTVVTHHTATNETAKFHHEPHASMTMRLEAIYVPVLLLTFSDHHHSKASTLQVHLWLISSVLLMFMHTTIRI